MTSEQFTRLSAGQFVRTKHIPGRFWCITKVYVPAGGRRVFELEGRVWIGPEQIDEVLAAA